MSENNNRGAAGGAAGKISDAYVDAYEQAILGIATPDWGDHWLTNAGAAITADELAQAGKQIGRAYIDAHERAVLITIELRERLYAATNTDWVKSMASAQAAIERDAVNACFSLARGLLV
jgi:hypothetical protein